MIASTSPAMKMPLDCGRAAEERDEAERAVQPRLDVVGDERAEHEDPPEPEHDARDRGEHLDERRRRCRRTPRGASSLRNSAIAIASGTARSRAPSATSRPCRRDRAARRRRLGSRPRRVPQRKAMPNLLEGEARRVDDLPDDRDHHDDRGHDRRASRSGRAGDGRRASRGTCAADADARLAGTVLTRAQP